MTNGISETKTLKIPLSFEAHNLAKRYSQKIKNTQQNRKVYLNTLAIYATDFQLRCLQFETNWSGSEHQDLLMRSLFDIADLEVKEIGRLECRPILSESNVMSIPSETWEDRISYVAVKLNANLTEASILGFTKTPKEQVDVNELDSFDNFLEYLCELEQKQSIQEPINETITNLGQWLQGAIADSWQTLDSLLNPAQVRFARATEFSVSRGRKIDLVFPIKTVPIVLITKINSESENEIDILVQVHPFEQLYLPEGLKLLIQDETEEIVLEAQAREQENWIQLAFSAELGEKFNVVIVLNDCKVSQPFVA